MWWWRVKLATGPDVSVRENHGDEDLGARKIRESAAGGVRARRATLISRKDMAQREPMCYSGGNSGLRIRAMREAGAERGFSPSR